MDRSVPTREGQLQRLGSGGFPIKERAFSQYLFESCVVVSHTCVDPRPGTRSGFGTDGPR
jgi:hypothetical protein